MRALFTTGGLIGIFCEEPTHFGRGRAVGLVDLPIQRSSVTNLPIGQSSSIRGMLRSFLVLNGKKELAESVFGSEPGEVETRAGHVDISDAKLLLMAVRSVVGLFCWLTCPTCLNDLCRALIRVKEVTDKSLSNLHLPKELLESLEEILKKQVPKGGALVPRNSENVIEIHGKLVLLDGEIELEAKSDENVNALAEPLSNFVVPAEGYLKNVFKRRFAIVEDDVFKFATERGLEVATRIRTNYETKTVERGGLWSEEYLPAFSFLFSEVYFHRRVPTEEGEVEADEFRKFMEFIDSKRVFVGGKEGVGKGLVYLKAYYERDTA
ncbi:type III-B CRISPR module RAMP protein Cmr4 [Candidatus Bathyarchaeota archaeon]|nr:MAG: type III-B CRISPR module RAMP protein Cmr4 [Candidatus Bathyarchaeota archaeon]